MSRSPRKHSDAGGLRAALQEFKKAAAAGRVSVEPRVYDRLMELPLAGTSLSDAIRKVAGELSERDAVPIKDNWDQRSFAFRYNSPSMGCVLYVKFRLEGRRPLVKLYSLHPCDYS